VLVSTVDLRNLVAKAAGRASLCCERPTRNGRRRFAAKLPECPSTESSRWVGRRSDFRTTNGCLLVSGFHQQFLICVGRIHQIFWPAHQEGQPLRRRRATKIVTKLIAVGPFLFPYRSTRGRTGRVAHHKSSSATSAALSTFIPSFRKFASSAQIALRMRGVDEQHSLLLEYIGNRCREL
jgi:hypothetical protein